ncbi:Uncharacterised protein [Mycobacteroides abscessus subsp. abscessus]|nr:Uncharacterised protein [Mycobacteroides abscessus subsp. abscessus]
MPNIPMPTMNTARYEPPRVRSRITRRGSRACGVRDCHQTNPASNTAPTTSQVMVAQSAQPLVSAFEKP